ncbi:MAG: response regulator [Acidobacteria bacterium]|nr:response regulator [Acidobacteriota bacterium]
MQGGMPADAAVVPVESGARGRVLLVDCELDDLHSYAETLQREGYEVRTCACHCEGLTALEEESFDFVVVCQGTAAFEGRAILERVKQIDRHIPVLVIARCHDTRCYIDAIHLGAIDYYEKPLHVSEIVRLVKNSLLYRRPAT